METPNNNQYSEDSIRSLDWKEHIRLRPGMYIGKLGDGSSADDGIYVLIKEVVDNSIDEHMMGHGKKIEIKILTNLVLDVVKQNQELTNKIVDICKTGLNSQTNNISNSNINSNNKTFNLQFFLNETCKNAMNITDFINSLQIQLSDLENVGKLGYVDGISSIIVKNLNALDETTRPIHCTDKKRETFYIKDEDKWEKEDSEKNKIKNVIKNVACKNQRLLTKFKELHPGCNFSESKYADQYSKLVIEAMGGAGNNDAEKEDQIIRKIAKEVVIDKCNKDD
jgi:hypothetical protein